MLKKIIMMFLVLISLSNYAYALDVGSEYIVDMNKLEIGDVPEEFGTVVVEKGKIIKGKKVFKGFQDSGVLEIELPNLRKNFEIEFLATGIHTYNKKVLSIKSDGGNVVSWKFAKTAYTAVIVGEKGYTIQNYKQMKPNKFKIKSKGRVVKFYVNDEFIVSQLHNTDEVYTKLTMDLNNRETEVSGFKFTQN